jgi:hypothetical protein
MIKIVRKLINLRMGLMEGYKLDCNNIQVNPEYLKSSDTKMGGRKILRFRLIYFSVAHLH